jgi:hypothetical protein
VRRIPHRRVVGIFEYVTFNRKAGTGETRSKRASTATRRKVRIKHRLRCFIDRPSIANPSRWAVGDGRDGGKSARSRRTARATALGREAPCEPLIKRQVCAARLACSIGRGYPRFVPCPPTTYAPVFCSCPTRPHVRLSTGRPVSQYAGSEGCTGLAGAEPHA